jgi:mRNA interferase MazF
MPPARGEVWLFDCGTAGKVRPVVVLSVAYGGNDRALVTVVPHTTALRGSVYEVVVPAPFLKAGAFLAQGIATYPVARALRKLGTLQEGGFTAVCAAVLRWLGQP